MVGKGVGWAGLVPGRRCGKGVGNVCFYLSKYVKKKKNNTLGVVSKSLNRDEGMVLCMDMENSCLIVCLLCLWAQSSSPRVRRDGIGSGEIRRILYRGCTDYLVSVPGTDKLFLQQRVAQDTVKFGQDSERQELEAQYLFKWLGFSLWQHSWICEMRCPQRKDDSGISEQSSFANSGRPICFG